MERHHHFFILSFLLLSPMPGPQQGLAMPQFRPKRLSELPKKLFVFGDSYADTGNQDFQYFCWKDPYGMTYPGHPTGRSSDGRVSTDYIAEYMKIKTPVPLALWVSIKAYSPIYIDSQLAYGMNFAYGGAGVFSQDSNVTIQIDNFQKVINQSVYTNTDLKSSVAYVTLAGNDYHPKTTSNLTKGSPIAGTPQCFKELETCVQQVVNQLAIDLKRIHNLGVKKVAVDYMGPAGCVPEFTVSSRECNGNINRVSNLHNLYLQQAVRKLNAETNSTSNFVILDLYTAFNNATKKFENPYEACCAGTSSKYSCGSVDGNGEKQYKVCDDPKKSFFWDNVHLTQQGWDAVFSTAAMKESLEQLSL